MATLNVKNFPEPLYKQLRLRAKRDGRSLAGEVTYLLAEQLMNPKRYTLDDWRGAGAGLWKGVDVPKFVEKQRKSW